MIEQKKREYLENHILIKKLYKETKITLDDFLNETIHLNLSKDHVVSVFGYDGELHLQQERPPHASYWGIDPSYKHEIGERLKSLEKNKRRVIDCAILVWLVITPPDDRWKYTREAAYDYIKSLPDVVRVELNRDAGRQKPEKSQDDWRSIFETYIKDNDLYRDTFKSILKMMEKDGTVEQEPDGKYTFEAQKNAKTISESRIQNYLSEINIASKSQNPKIRLIGISGS